MKPRLMFLIVIVAVRPSWAWPCPHGASPVGDHLFVEFGDGTFTPTRCLDGREGDDAASS